MHFVDIITRYTLSGSENISIGFGFGFESGFGLGFRFGFGFGFGFEPGLELGLDKTKQGNTRQYQTK
jgi:hypothetical protein